MLSEVKKNLLTLLPESLLTSEQVKAVSFMVNNDKGVVIAPTGVGKTIISLTAISKTGYKYIVAAPPKVIANWPNESKKWNHTKHLRLTLLTGTPEERSIKLKHPSDVILISLNSLEWLLNTNHGATAIIIDELSKAAGKQTAKLKNKSNDKITYRMGLTATPVSDSFLKLYPMLRIIDGGLALGRNKQGYLSKYFHPTDYKQYNWELNQGSDFIILEKIKHLICDVKTNKADTLPPIEYHELVFDMPKTTRDIYTKMKRDLLIEGASDVVAPNMAVLSGKLRQIASGFVIAEDKNVIDYDTARAETLINLLLETPEDSALVLYENNNQRIQIINLLRETAFTYSAVFGGSDNTEDINKFKRGDINILVAQINTLSHGHDGLQYKCSHLVFYAPIWSNDSTIQAIGRIWRQGTEAKRVKVTTLVCDKTLDDIVLSRLETKSEGMEMFLSHLRG